MADAVYALPRELVEKRPVYLELPRKPYSILRTHDYDKLLMDDAFLELVWGLLCVDGVAVFQGAGSARRAS